MVSSASQYTPDYFHQKKQKYNSLLLRKNKRSDTLLALVKKNLINCALHLADNAEDVDAIYWICEKFTQSDPDISISEKQFKKYIKISALEKSHQPSMELLAKYYLKDCNDGNSNGGIGFKPDIFKKDAEIKIYDDNATNQSSYQSKDEDKKEEKNNEEDFTAEKVKSAHGTQFSSLKDEIDKKRKVVTDIFKKELLLITRDKVDEILRPFDDLIGLNDIKKQIRQLAYNMVAHSKRRKLNIDTDYAPSLHMVFSGNTGTGKTTVARMLGAVLKELGYLSQGHVLEVDRSSLVGSYIGHTEYYTSEALNKAKGGVLFVDEAYGLNKGLDWDFGAEAIELIIKEMEDSRDDLVVIFAGYPEEMGWFVKMNPGLQSRVAMTLDFPDYSDDELTNIFEQYVRDQSFIIDNLALEKVKLMIKKMPANEKQKFGNARGVRNLFEKVLQNQATRIVEQDIEDKNDLITILAQDIPYHIADEGRAKTSTISQFENK